MSILKLRIGSVPYLNVLPLEYGLAERPEVELVHRVPSELTGLLTAREIEVGIVPLAEYLRGVGECLLPGMSISSQGPVRSVLVFLTCPPDRVITLATDTSSRSSAALAKVVFRKCYGIDPLQVPGAPDLEAMLRRADAALLIGDAALACENSPYDRIDLGEAWHDLTGLPFTFAGWVARAGARMQVLTGLLRQAKEAGVAHVRELAEQAAAKGRFSAAEVESYLKNNVNHDLTTAHLQGIERFARYTAELGIISQPRRVRIADT